MEVLDSGISNFCRFCLSQDNEDLTPLSSAIRNSFLSLQDIQETTGISILESETACLAVCTTCSNCIELTMDFRRSCIKANIEFLQLFGYIIDKLRSSNIAEENLEDAAYINDDPLEIEIALKTESNNGIIHDAHSIPELPVEESQELIDKRSTNGQEDCEDGNSSSEDLPPVATNMLRLKDKTTNTKIIVPTSSQSKVKSKERIITSANNKVNKSAKSRKQLCGICGALVRNIIDHTRSHTKENLHKCPHCPVQMANRTNLVRHVRTVHEKIIIKSCESCGKGFTTDNTYKSHMRAHHNIGAQYQCEVCLKMFNHASNRRQHIQRIHVGEFNYKCQICQQMFKDPNSLKRHGMVHSTDTPYVCSHCPKRFKSSNARKTHELTHSGIQFTCTLCTKVYRYKTLLNMHYRKCHPTECGDK